MDKRSLKKKRKEVSKNDQEVSKHIDKKKSIKHDNLNLVPGRKLPDNDRGCPNVQKYRDDNFISISVEEPLFDPIFDFSELDFQADLLLSLSAFERPTPIQSQCWPIILSKRDLIGIAETGSGKTLAFSLPLLFHILNSKSSTGPKVLILSPTRELATQTSEVIKEAGKVSGLKVCF